MYYYFVVHNRSGGASSNTTYLALPVYQLHQQSSHPLECPVGPAPPVCGCGRNNAMLHCLSHTPSVQNSSLDYPIFTVHIRPGFAVSVHNSPSFNQQPPTISLQQYKISVASILTQKQCYHFLRVSGCGRFLCLVDALPCVGNDPTMSCLGLIFSFFRRAEVVNGESYNVVKRIGEGGMCM